MHRYYRSGLYESVKPEILGCEAEGVIEAIGPGETYSLQPGDRVVYMTSKGTYAEYTAASALRCIKIPPGVPPTHAVAALTQGLTALTMVRESYAVQPNDWVLVTAAAGGCGLWLCQILRAIGARTIGIVSLKEKAELARQNGAGWVIDRLAESEHVSAAQQVKDITGGEGVAVVFDGVGKSSFERSLEVLARKGTLVSFGNASGDVPPFPIR